MSFNLFRHNNAGIQDFNEALMLDEFEPTVLYHLGHIRVFQRRYDIAYVYFQRLEQVEGVENQAKKLAEMLGKETLKGQA